MRVRVRLFAFQRAQTGEREVALELPDGASIQEAWAALVLTRPVLAGAEGSLRFARNGVYADATDRLVDGDELAVIPPVAGGRPEPGGLGSERAPLDPDAPPPPDHAPRPPGDAPLDPDTPPPSDHVPPPDDAPLDPDAPPPPDHAPPPPVRPLRPRDRAPVRRIAISSEPLDARRLAVLLEEVPTSADGAVATFVGRTRETPGTPAPGQEAEAARYAGQRVEGLVYEAFEPMALAVLETIADEIASRFDVHGLAIVHRVGEVAVGEVSVVIVAAAPHREAAFAACRYAIEELKARAPIWKAERFADGSVWLGAPARSGPEDAQAGG